MQLISAVWPGGTVQVGGKVGTVTVRLQCTHCKWGCPGPRTPWNRTRTVSFFDAERVVKGQAEQVAVSPLLWTSALHTLCNWAFEDRPGAFRVVGYRWVQSGPGSYHSTSLGHQSQISFPVRDVFLRKLPMVSWSRSQRVQSRLGPCENHSPLRGTYSEVTKVSLKLIIYLRPRAPACTFSICRDDADLFTLLLPSRGAEAPLIYCICHCSNTSK